MNIAHELTHQFENSVSKDTYTMRWMLEGTADVMAASVMSLNGMGNLNDYSKSCILTLKKVPRVPDIAKLGNVEDWRESANSTGFVVNYRTSDAAVIYLISKVGYRPIFTYFQILGDTRDEKEAFVQAFGMSLEDFEEEFRGYLADKGINN